ncbi:hypothetical protein ROLI_015270 [Roseobacter fucihabitans]|uniref:Response regulatory domain-containing protein n=2 Tax=Roseobacter fucihabitans TaxID=1537242 RepID=A0ABZ2BTB3_9RHOB|nr:response regulator PleD [Roseobacter litoralis]
MHIDKNDPALFLGKVMIIDDDRVDQAMCQRTLIRARLAEEVISFMDAEKALAYLRTPPGGAIDVILLDVNLPRMNGLEFLETATNDANLIFAPAVLVMISTPLPLVQKNKFSGMSCVQAFLDKPLKVEELMRLRPVLQAAHCD